MPYRYENDRRFLMREILRCAHQDREAMVFSLRGSDHPDDIEYLEEIDAVMNDIIRMDANLGLGIFHPDIVKRLARDAGN
jgi:hypothetical protein